MAIPVCTASYLNCLSHSDKCGRSAPQSHGRSVWGSRAARSPVSFWKSYVKCVQVVQFSESKATSGEQSDTSPGSGPPSVQTERTSPLPFLITRSDTTASRFTHHEPREARASRRVSLAIRGATDGPRNDSPTVPAPYSNPTPSSCSNSPESRFEVVFQNRIAQLGFGRR